jgi:hypothetical protein
MKRTILLLTGLAFACLAPAQSKKEVKKNKIKSITEYRVVVVNGGPVSLKSSYEEFDRSGHTTLQTEYDKQGTMKSQQAFQYDLEGNRTEETEYDSSGALRKRTAITYNSSGDKATETEYDGKGAVVKKTRYNYNAEGDNIEETVSDAGGNTLKRTVYVYNSRDLKTEKHVYQKNSKVPESVKKWSYEYY